MQRLLLRLQVLTRGQLAAARSLAQVDAKFIAVAAGDVLAIVDQHAADERVRLERLRDQVKPPLCHFIRHSCCLHLVGISGCIG